MRHGKDRQSTGIVPFRQATPSYRKKNTDRQTNRQKDRHTHTHTHARTNTHTHTHLPDSLKLLLHRIATFCLDFRHMCCFPDK
jgi:ABC-type nickel/cobalt efflux system permease component RcnA